MNIKSMTGFGEAASNVEGSEIRVEIKSVNNRFLDCNVKLPSVFSSRESDIQAIARKFCRRGRVDVFVARNTQRGTDMSFALNSDQLKSYLETAQAACKQSKVSFDSVKNEIIVQALSRREILELTQVEQVDESEQTRMIEVVQEAFAKLAKMRETEGAQLSAALSSHLGVLRELTKQIETKAVAARTSLQQRLEERLAKLSPSIEIDPQRLAQEVVILADKADIVEELVRLSSHFGQFQSAIDQGDGGRKLEFLLQECNREVNTIGSKSQDSEITSLVVEAKTELEKLREQVQNIE